MTHWFWLAAVLLFAAMEAATTALVSIWFVAGAVLALLSSLFHAPLWLQFALFLFGSIVTLAALRPLVKKFGGNSVPTNLDRVVGQSARVTECIDPAAGTGAVYVDGKTWTARCADDSVIPVGKFVVVERIEGVKLFVKAATASVSAETAQNGKNQTHI